MGKKGGNTTTSSSQPWGEAIPYLTGGEVNGTTVPGVLPSAADLYGSSGWSQAMTDNVNNYLSQLAARSGQSQSAYNLGNNAISGNYGTNISAIGPISQTNQINASSVNPVSARASQGVLDPTAAMYNMLQGQPDTQYLDKTANAITNNFTRNTMENVMPTIGSNALAAGQYGGSRQGLAQGLAISRMNQDLAPSITGMYSNAFENAQQRMYGTANALNNQATEVATGNANRELMAQITNAANNQSTNQFNANLGLQNNAQTMQQAQNNWQTMLQGLNALGYGNALQDSTYNNTFGALGAQNAYNWNNLNNYANIINSAARGGGKTTQEQGTDPFTQGLGALVTLGGLK